MSKKQKNTPLVHRVRATIKHYGLLQSIDDCVIVGISGGADSCALLLVLHLLGYKLIAAHCNFSLRERESDEDALFVRRLCEELGIPLEIVVWDTQKEAKKRGCSIEVAARDLRYDFFEQLYIQHNAQAIAVAHHAGDNVETMLQHLSAGCGIRGLRGMLYKRGNVIRPLLEVSSYDLKQFLEQIGVKYRIDSTNEDVTIERNFVRHRLCPLFEELNQSFIRSSVQTLKILRELEQIYLHYINAHLPLFIQGNDIDLEEISKSQAPLSILYEILSPLGFNSIQIEEVLASFIAKSKGEKDSIFTSKTHFLIRKGASLHMEKIDQEESDRTIFSVEIKRIVTEQYEKEALPITFELLRKCPSFKYFGKNAILLDWDKLMQGNVETFIWRSVFSDDVFAPFGMNGRHKTVGKMLHDAKIPSFLRKRQKVLCTNTGELLWLPGIASSNFFTVTEKTTQFLVVSLNHSDESD